MLKCQNLKLKLYSSKVLIIFKELNKNLKYLNLYLKSKH